MLRSLGLSIFCLLSISVLSGGVLSSSGGMQLSADNDRRPVAALTTAMLTKYPRFQVPKLRKLH